ncbi:MAG: type II toxin-antitoxin system VapC family toxin [Deltaproteobacteria bacterium]
MRTAVDSSVLLDVIVDDQTFAAASEAALRAAMALGVLVIGECVLAEIRPAFRKDEVESFLDDWAIDFTPSSRQSAILAGEMFEAHLSRRARGKALRVLPDFLIGAHASTHADRLLARDRGYYRDYFKQLLLVEP